MIKIATFNIQNFGASKAKKPAVMQTLADIIRKYDVVAVQEVSDKTGQTPRAFLNLVNSNESKYQMVLSERSGLQRNDKTSQEAYAYYFNTKTIASHGAATLFDDSQKDYFQREPFLARFKTVRGNFTFVVVSIHTRPEDAVKEIGALHNVVEWAKTIYPGEDDFITVGDYNASCSYASSGRLDQLEFRKNYRWIVPDDADTNLAKARCAYDRIVLTKGVDTDYAGSWGIDKSFTDKTVSDHWPVWAAFYVNKDRN